MTWRPAIATPATILAALALGALAGCDEPPGPSGATPPATAPSASVADSTSGPGWFTDVTESVGLSFVHDAGVDGSFYYPQMLGSGVALLDYDGDGDLDVYVVNGAYRDGGVDPAPTNRLFRRSADGTYADVTAEAGVGDAGFGMGAAVGDFDNDGHPDVYVTNCGADVMYRNDGDGTFTDVTADAGIDNDQWACSASFLDYDRDGHLDLFVVNYVDNPTPRACADWAGRPEFCGPSAFPPTSDLLFHNNGDGTFTDVSDASGVSDAQGRGLGIACEDFDGDGLIDVYVANDGDPNFLWVNNGDGTFTESATMLGTALNAFGSTEASMGVAVGDVDDDGDPDLFMTHLARESNTFYRNDGAGAFNDETATAGLGGPSFPYTGFGTAFFDYDNDGWLDVIVVNGRVKRDTILPGADRDNVLAAYAEPNLLFRNDRDGRFVDVSNRAGTLCHDVHVSRGLAVGDVDDDGDLDVAVANGHGPFRLYRNDTPQPGHWLIVRVVDEERNRDAYGARVEVTAGGRTLHRTINPGYSYASSSDPRAHFGLGAAERIDEVVVRWPDGRVDRHDGVAVDRVVTFRGSTRVSSANGVAR